MIILIIDTKDKECLVALKKGGVINVEKWLWKNDTGQEVLNAIKTLNQKAKIKLEDIDVIGVQRGPGSYTGTRVGIVVANSLGFGLEKPVIGYQCEEIEKIFREIEQKAKSKKLSPRFPTPIYNKTRLG